jgi:hypothetical protein
MTIHATLETRAQTLTSLIGYALGRLHSQAECWGAVGSVVVMAIHSGSSSIVVFTASECWVSTSEATVIASGIKGAAFALVSAASSSVMA